jgi:5'-nucleotidase
MNNHRRAFISQLSLLAGAAALTRPFTSVAAVSKHIHTLGASRRSVTIYYTNDLHGNFDAACGDLGGLRHVEKLLHRQETAGLLLDGGDFLKKSLTIGEQKQVISTMNWMGYRAAAVGNHELADGGEHLAQLAPLMNFTLVNSNYELKPELSRFVKPYIIVNTGNYKIGITGVGHAINGIPYRNAIDCANAVAELLKVKEKCDLVICLSHLGYTQKDDLPDNKKLAKSSEHIDMIVSGHGRTLLRGPAIALNKHKQEVVIGHAAWNGAMMGKTVFGFEGDKQKHDIKTKHIIPGQPYGQSFAETFAALRGMEKQLV